MKKTYAKIILSMIIGMMFFSRTANADIRTWVGSVSTSWSDPANWLEGSVPGSTDDVLFDWNALNDCTLDITTSIQNLTVNNFDYLLTIPSGYNISIAGDIFIGVRLQTWINTSNIILNGSGNQTIKIETYVDWPFYDLTINKPSGTIILDSNIKVIHDFSNISGTTIVTNGFSIVGGCIPPQTGGIYHIANDFAL